MSSPSLKIKLLIALFTSISLSNCSGAAEKASTSLPLPPASAPMTAQNQIADRVTDKPKAITVSEEVKTAPQLIKKADLTILVKSIDESMRSITKIVEKQAGDILGFQDQKPPDSSSRHTASMQIRVPQEKLDKTLNDLGKIGNIQFQSMTAEDVSQQLVDNAARLRNLKKSEELVLKIMERSGSVGDVLKAAQELSQIRESIERLDAQLKNLQNQVAYSTINISLEEAIKGVKPSEPSLSLQAQETWGKATNAVGNLTWGIAALFIWLAAFSPYIFLIICGIYLLRYRFGKKPNN